MVTDMVHELFDIENTEAELQKKYKKVGDHLYARIDKLKIRPLTEEQKKNIQIVFVMGGEGTRLSHHTMGKISKHMISVSGQPISKYTFDLWRNAGFSNFCFLIDNTEMGKSIQEFYGDGSKFGVNISYSIEEKRLGSGGAIKQAMENGTINRSFIIHYPDDQMVNYPNFGEDFGGIVVAAPNAGYKVVVTCVPGTRYQYGEVVSNESGEVVDFVEKPFIRKDTYTSISGLSEEAFGRVKEIDSSKGPVKIEDITLSKYAQAGEIFEVLIPTEYWIAVNDEPSLRKFEDFINYKK